MRSVRSREFRVSDGELPRGMSVMARLTAANTAWNLPPVRARSRFHPCQYAGKRCSMRDFVAWTRPVASGAGLA